MAAGARRGPDDRTLDLDLAVLVGLFLVEILVEPDQLLAAADDAPHHPIKRAAGQQLLGAARRVPGIDPMWRARRLAALLPAVGLKLFHVREVVDADRQLDQM